MRFLNISLFLVLINSSYIYACKIVSVENNANSGSISVEIAEDQVIKAKPASFGANGIYLDQTKCVQTMIQGFNFIVLDYITHPQGTSQIVWDKVREVYFFDTQSNTLESVLSVSLIEDIYDAQKRVKDLFSQSNNYEFFWKSKGNDAVIIEVHAKAPREDEDLVKSYIFKSQTKVFNLLD